jgi:hypothetical protein
MSLESSIRSSVHTLQSSLNIIQPTKSERRYGGGACSNQEHDNKRVEILIVKLKKNTLFGDLENTEK